jgi:L-ascorbate metabolism protein UlaG (beta-lactamase superfamily)
MTGNPLEGITWLGHASFKVKVAEAVIYIDPWKLDDGEPADIILITHGHRDHFSPPDLDKIRKRDTVLISVEDVCTSLKSDVRTVKAGDKLTVKGVEIEVVPAYNLARQYHPRAKGGVGYILQAQGRCIYHAGDTDVIPEMAHITADVALLPAGGTYTMDASEAAKAANIIKPSVAVPMHWGDIVGSRADAEAFKAQCQVPVQIMEKG